MTLVSSPSSSPVGGGEDDVISLAPLWSLVRRYRRWLELAFFAALILGLGLAAAAYLYVPRKVRTAIEFSLTFPDASLGIYPNRSPFRPEDLLEAGLLRGVYEGNGLGIFLEFDDFRAGFSVERAGRETELLQRELRVRLDDRKLTLADREKIEKNYTSRLKTLPPTYFRVNFVQSGRSARLIPLPVRTKVLEDILRLWSEEAVLQKQVLAYAARLPGSINAPKPSGDLLISMLELNERTRVLAEGLAELARLPGGYQACLANGARLVDLQLRLGALQEIRIPQIRSALFGGIADPGQAALIAGAFRQQARMREERLRLAEEKLRSSLSTYRDYLASRPEAAAITGPAAGAEKKVEGGTQLQISDTFLAKVMDLGKGSMEDEAYRGSLVEKIREGRLEVAEERSALREAGEILKALETGRPEGEGKKPSSAKARVTTSESVEGADFTSELLLGCREFNGLLADGEKLRAVILENYLNPQVSLYRISEPVLSETSSALTPRDAGLFLAVFVLAGLGLTLVACWAHDQSTKPQA
jgi:hypothetical protein